MIFASVGEWLPATRLPAAVDPGVDETWRATWMTAVRNCAHPGLLVDLPSNRVLQVSAGVVERLSLGEDPVAALAGLVDSAGGGRVLALLADGVMESAHGRRGYRTADGSPVEVWCWARAVHSPSGAVMALMGLEDATVAAEAPAMSSVPFTGGVAHVHRRQADLIGVIELDHAWCVTRMTAGPRYAADGSTGPRERSYVLDSFAVESQPSLLCTLASATSGATAGVWLRLSSTTGRGPVVSAVVALQPDDPSRFVVELYALDDPQSERSAARAAELERRMRRIAAEVRAADVVDAPDRDLTLRDVPLLADLSERQVEILARLLRGQRVPAIAQHMYLAPSTVRNHLSTVFRKLGVHSQAELIDLVRSSTSNR